MSKLTSNYNFIKPELTDPANITVMNENWDKIDEELKKQADATPDVSTHINNHNSDTSAHSDIRELVTTAKTTADNAANAAASAQSTASGKADKTHTHTKSQITDFPSSMPASDVYSWAKQSSKPTYTPSEIGAAPAYTYGTTDLTAGTSTLATGKLYLVYE